MGNTVANSNTHVANATGGPLRVYYSVDRMRLEEMVTEVQGELTGHSGGGGSGTLSGGVKLVFKPDSRIRFIRIPVNDFSKITGEGAMYVTVFAENPHCLDECTETISENFHIPSDRSFIVTPNLSLKFQKYAADKWVDEQGHNHRPY